VSNVTDIPI